MSYRNSFYLVGHGNPNLRYFDSIQKRELAKVFCGRRGDIIYTRHLYYTNFTEFGCNVRYFNIVGEYNFILQNHISCLDERSCS